MVANAGYANGTQVAALQTHGMDCYVAARGAVNNQAAGALYDRAAFTYDAAHDHFVCPAGQLLQRKQSMLSHSC
ncbi:hypothetical protein [Variovorax sp. GB1P17]|uniref:hypothetical protein n=1 Tax=Variovorax sp. GB1P17 TaxID=3443740 RepID=UPI003F468050